MQLILNKQSVCSCIAVDAFLSRTGAAHLGWLIWFQRGSAAEEAGKNGANPSLSRSCEWPVPQASVRTPARAQLDEDRRLLSSNTGSPRHLGRAVMASLALLLIASPAWSHHPFGMGESRSAWQGLLSGLGHPLLGPDHLLFLIAIAFIGLKRPMAWVIRFWPSGLVAALSPSFFPCQTLLLPGPKPWCP